MIIIVQSPYLYRLKKKTINQNTLNMLIIIITVDQKNQCQVWLSLEAEVKQ